MSRVLKGRYFATTSILNAGRGNQPSFGWQSISHGRDLLKRGLRFLIGDGESISLWTDLWLDMHPPRPPQPNPHSSLSATSLHDLINPITNRWNVDKIAYMVDARDIDRILRIKLPPRETPNLLSWHYTNTCIYTVKSGYWLATHLPDWDDEIIPPAENIETKKRIWKLDTTPKIKHFFWHMLSNALGTGCALKQRKIIRDDTCKRCCKEAETT